MQSERPLNDVEGNGAKKWVIRKLMQYNDYICFRNIFAIRRNMFTLVRIFREEKSRFDGVIILHGRLIQTNE